MSQTHTFVSRIVGAVELPLTAFEIFVEINGPFVLEQAVRKWDDLPEPERSVYLELVAVGKATIIQAKLYELASHLEGAFIMKAGVEARALQRARWRMDDAPVLDGYSGDRIGNGKGGEHWLPLSDLKLRDPSNKIAAKHIKNCEDFIRLTKPRGITEAKPWQVDVTAAVKMGHDVLALAATASGKSLCFQMIAASPGTFIVLSPLKGLVKDQAKELNDMGVKTIGLTDDSIASYSKENNGADIWDDIADCKYRCIVAPPELLFDNGCKLWKTMKDERKTHKFFKDLQCCVVDECNIIWKWGGLLDPKTGIAFRVNFKLIGNFRLLFPELPYMLLSATVNPAVRSYLFKTLKLHSPSYILRTSLERPNIRLLFAPTISPKSSSEFKELDFLFSEAIKEKDPKKIPKTIIYTDARSRVQDVARYLRNTLGKGFESSLDHEKARDLISVYTGFYDDRSNTFNMTLFRGASIDETPAEMEALGDGRFSVILVCTEAAGMGLDIRDVEVVVQHRLAATTTAAELWQRLGSFDYSLPITPETVRKVKAQLLRIYSKENRIGGVLIDPALFWLINTTGCRIRLIMALFGDPSAFNFERLLYCKCDNCSFPLRSETNRHIPPVTLVPATLRPQLKAGPNEIVDSEGEDEDEEPLDAEKEAAKAMRNADAVAIANIGQEIIHGFKLSSTIRFRDTAAFERAQIAERNTVERKEYDGPPMPQILKTKITERLCRLRTMLAESDTIAMTFGLIGPKLFPDALIHSIAHNRDVMRLVDPDERASDAAILDSITASHCQLSTTLMSGFVVEIKSNVIEAYKEYKVEEAARQEAQRLADEKRLADRKRKQHEDRLAKHRERSASVSSIGSRTSSRNASPEPDRSVDELIQTMENNDLFCPVCKRTGQTLKTKTNFDKHLKSAGHIEALRITSIPTHTKHRAYKAFQQKMNNSTEDNSGPTRDDTSTSQEAEGSSGGRLEDDTQQQQQQQHQTQDQPSNLQQQRDTQNSDENAPNSERIEAHVLKQNLARLAQKRKAHFALEEKIEKRNAANANATDTSSKKPSNGDKTTTRAKKKQKRNTDGDGQQASQHSQSSSRTPRLGHPAMPVRGPITVGHPFSYSA
ncbi:hypothetical protein BJ508DRAFT_315870 [Ascobolus immersus RN42]|uniref:DNA 3'-5' helicase n=1 Tax=Ascobolus immersus RN42 TaxID=1160509 RepID=A0A3N4HBH2_ASCIM|nr:hypothetical protein BJ508DRAFT_315870 [Ascobolus immersus RN42]